MGWDEGTVPVAAPPTRMQGQACETQCSMLSSTGLWLVSSLVGGPA